MRVAASFVRVWLMIAVGTVAAGCGELRLRRLPSNPAPPVGEASSKDTAVDSSALPAKPASPLARDGWNAAVDPLPPIEPADGFRWRHRELEAQLELPPDERPDLIAALKDGESIASTNAAICLARAGQPAGREWLIKTIRDSTARLPLRCACAEALALVREPSPLEDLRDLVDRYGQFPSPAYQADVHAELLYGLAAHVDAGADERFTQALKSPSGQVRLAAVRGWLRSGDAALSDTAADLRTDQDERVRAAALEVMARRHHPLALEAARNALTDFRLEVRLAAVAALGEIGGSDARQALEKLDREPEIIRAAAIAALARVGARERVWAGAENESWHVRRAVAQALCHYPDAAGALLARRLLADHSLEVQKETLAALAQWPLETSGPVLLEAMSGNGYMSRKTAAAQLVERWPPAREFSADAPAERRAETMASLRRQWSGQFGLASVDGTGAVSGGNESRAAAPPAKDRVEHVASLVRRLQAEPAKSGAAAEVERELAACGPDLPALLQQLVETEHLVLPDAVFRDVLADFGGPYAELENLASSDVQERRRAANRLAGMAARKPLSDLVLSRISDLAASEPDTLVFNALFRAIANDQREPAVRLAYAGIGHGTAEVRRMAAAWLDEHALPAHAEALLPALDDPNYAVVLAAVKALGHRGMLNNPAPLERLLTVNDRVLRVAVAQSLTNLGAASGPQALELLAHDTDAETRRRAAQVMGTTGDRRYLETLIALLDDTLGVRTTALASLSEIVGHDVAEDADNPPTSSLDRIERWKHWWQREAKR